MVAAAMVDGRLLHCFRDTYITNQLHLHCANMAETMQLCQRIGHSDFSNLHKYFGKLKKPASRVSPSSSARLRRSPNWRQWSVLLKLKQVAAELGCCVKSVRRWIADGSLRAVRPGRE